MTADEIKQLPTPETDRQDKARRSASGVGYEQTVPSEFARSLEQCLASQDYVIQLMRKWLLLRSEEAEEDQREWVETLAAIKELQNG